jgi:hypothetical protein
MSKRPPEAGVELTDTDLYVIVDGVRIAKRVRPRTEQAGTWISLKPGWNVVSTPDFSEIYIGGPRPMSEPPRRHARERRGRRITRR